MLETNLFGNTLLAWSSALGLLLLAMLGVIIGKRVLRNRLAWLSGRTSNRIDDAMLAAVDGTRLSLLFLILLLPATSSLLLPATVPITLRTIALLAGCLQLGLWLNRMLDHWFDGARQHAMSTDASTATSLIAFKFVGRVLLWSVLLLLVLDNLGIDITALVAGLGVGGIAVALAMQNILGDLFASMSILVDQPFVIGDFITIGEFAGTIEHIGLKTTRIRSLGGEQLVFSNGDLLSSRIRNYKRMRERRVVFTFGLLYQTPVDTLEQIPQIVRGIIEAEAQTRFDRAHFKSFGDSSYDFEVVYWVLSADYNVYMDAQQQINLQMIRAFDEVGAEFAYPTRTVIVQRQARSPGQDDGDAPVLR